MAGGYGTRHEGYIGASDTAMGGAAQNLGIEALAGTGDMVTVFDDFNHVIPAETFGDIANWETSGWVLTDVGVPVADAVSMNAAATVTSRFDSCIRIDAGTAVDTGGNMQLDKVNAALPATGAHGFPHIWIPEDGAGITVLDNTILVFATRVGFITNGAAGAWDSKMFIGWAEAGDVGILTPTTGGIAQAETGPLVGFHINEGGTLRGISQRTVNTGYANGLNQVQLQPAGAPNSTLANGVLTVGDPVWFDLALRMHITDMDNAANGTTRFFWRRVPPTGPAAGAQDYPSPAQTPGPWNAFPTVLVNQTPNNDVALVPTIEVINGPANLCDILIDWWMFGISRFSRS